MKRVKRDMRDAILADLYRAGYKGDPRDREAVREFLRKRRKEIERKMPKGGLLSKEEKIGIAIASYWFARMLMP